MSALDELRAAQDRDVRLVGVPMFVVLRDETADPAPRPGAAGEDAAGDPLAERLDELRSGLAPSQRNGDLGVVATLLGVAAHLDLRGGQGGP